ncbi:hypothetical protein V3C99_003584 [Haemonchus contortus]
MNIDSDQPRQTEVLEVELKIRYFIYLVLGAVTCISSSICLIVFLSTNELRKKYVMFSALSVGDFLNGLSFVLAGMFREMALFQGVYFDKMTNRGCLLQTPWNILMIIAGQVPALLHIFVAFDRVAALQFVTIYRKELLIFQKKTYITLTIVLTSFFIIIAVVLNMYDHVQVLNDHLCSVMDSTGIYYGTIHYSLISIAYIFCFTVLGNLFRQTNKNRAPTAREIRRQRMILSLDLLSVFLVSIPNLVIILSGWNIPKVHPFVLGFVYCLYAIHSAIPLFIYLYFRMDFRGRFIELFGWRSRSRHFRTLEKPTVTATAVTVSAASNVIAPQHLCMHQ